MKKTSQANSRAAAASLLNRVVYLGESLSNVLSGDSDPLTRDIVYGCLRWHEPISALLEQLVQKPLKQKDKDVECLIRGGLYQIQYQKTPDHAAVNETVNALKSLKKPWAKKLVNGVLRRFIREKDTLLSETQKRQTVRYAFPLWLISRIRQAWPDRWEAILAASNERAPMTLRVNLSRITRQNYLASFMEAGIGAKLHERVKTALVLDKPVPVEELPGFDRGEVSVQDAAAQLAGELLDCQQGMRVLDACAAPGGKTGHLLESADDLAVVAMDSSEARLRRVRENLDRLGLKAELQAADAGDPATFADQGENALFDRILLDAPCTASGVIRRHPDIKLLRRESDIAILQKEQRRLLETLWTRLKPGGVLLYATCSILPEENEQQIDAFLEKQHDADLLPIDGAQGHGWQLFPGENAMDGFYYARLVKKAGC